MNQIPAKRNKFVEFDVGDRFFLRHKPLIKHQHYSDPKRTKTKLTPKLQLRYVGPYTITRKFSPVLYEALVDGEIRTVHALQMKPDPVSKYYTMHRQGESTMEPRKTPEFKAKLLPSGKPQIPRRIHRRLKAPQDPPLTNAQEQTEDHDAKEDEDNPDEDYEDSEEDSDLSDDEDDD
jgi:hypothetical protein